VFAILSDLPIGLEPAEHRYPCGTDFEAAQERGRSNEVPFQVRAAILARKTVSEYISCAGRLRHPLPSTSVPQNATWTSAQLLIPSMINIASSIAESSSQALGTMRFGPGSVTNQNR
jgi:hypothetical protein